MESTSHPNLLAGKGAMSFVTDAAWWKGAVRCCARFAPRCTVAAVLMTIANIGLVMAYNTLNAELPAITTQDTLVISNTDTALLNKLSSLLVAFGGASVGCLLLFVSLFIWLDKMHVFARAFSRRGADATAADFDEAQKFIKQNQRFLIVFWLVASGYVFLPSMIFTMLLAAKVVMTSELGSLFEIPFGWGREQFGHFCFFTGSIFFIGILAYSLAGVVFCSLASKAPGRVATELLRDMLRHPLPSLALTVLVCAIFAVVVTPFDTVDAVFPLGALKANCVFIVVSQIWAGVTSTIVLPLSVVPFCMITRHAESN